MTGREACAANGRRQTRSVHGEGGQPPKAKQMIEEPRSEQTPWDDIEPADMIGKSASPRSAFELATGNLFRHERRFTRMNADCLG